MSYDENRISDLIDGGLKKEQEMYDSIRQFETSRGTLLAVKIPDELKDRKIVITKAGYPDIELIALGGTHPEYIGLLPAGDWQPLGLLPDISEDQAKEVVDDESMGLYVDYAAVSDFGKKRRFDTALESLTSLLETGIKLRNTLKQPMALPGFEDNEGYLKSKSEWQSAEAEVWKHFYLIFKTK